MSLVVSRWQRRGACSAAASGGGGFIGPEAAGRALGVLDPRAGGRLRLHALRRGRAGARVSGPVTAGHDRESGGRGRGGRARHALEPLDVLVERLGALETRVAELGVCGEGRKFPPRFTAAVTVAGPGGYTPGAAGLWRAGALSGLRRALAHRWGCWRSWRGPPSSRRQPSTQPGTAGTPPWSASTAREVEIRVDNHTLPRRLPERIQHSTSLP